MADDNTPPDDGEDAPVDVSDEPREPTEYERRLRRESAKYRRQAREAAEQLTARETALKAEHDAALAAASRAANERLIRAELKAAAKDAGMVDLDGLKLLDLSGVKLSDNGDLVLPEKFFDSAKAAKPYLFKTTGAESGNTSSTSKPPEGGTPAPKQAKDMSTEELVALERQLGLSALRR